MRDSIVDWILIAAMAIAFACLLAGWPFLDLIK
jgi:hypothetical protein